MSSAAPPPRPTWTDRLEFELRLVPGVVSVAAHAARVSIAASSRQAGERAEELVRSRLGTEVAVDVVFPPSAEPHLLIPRIHEVPGVQTCSATRDEDGTIATLEVTTGHIRAADLVHQIVADAFGEPFARERLLVALELPVTRVTPS